MKGRRLARTGAAVVTTMMCASGAVVLAAPAGASTSHTLTVSVTRNHHVSAPSRTRPGITRVRDTGVQPIMMYAGGAGRVRTLVADLNAALRGSNLQKLQRDFAFGGEIDQGYDGYLPLHPGTYYVVDVGHSRSQPYTTSEVASVTVKGSRLDARLPASDTVSIAGNGAVRTHSMTRHVHYARLVNGASHDVAVAAVRVGNGVSTAKVRRYLAHPSFSHLIDVSPGRYPDYRIAQEVPAGQTATLPQFLTTGRYVVVVVEYVRGHMQDAVARRQASSFTVR